MRSINRVTAFLIVMFAASVATSIATLRRQDQPKQSQQNPATNLDLQEKKRIEFESHFPLISLETLLPADPDKRAKRKIKNERYDKGNFVSRETSGNYDEVEMLTHWEIGLPALPVAQSAAIVVGEAVEAQAHLSNDKTNVYTEFTIRVNEVLNTTNPTSLVSGSLINADRTGGFVRYPNGHKMLYRVFGFSMLRTGKRYVLFLTNPDQSPNYQVLTGYELGASAVSPLDSTPQFEKYKGMDPAAFLEAVRDAIAQQAGQRGAR